MFKSETYNVQRTMYEVKHTWKKEISKPSYECRRHQQNLEVVSFYLDHLLVKKFEINETYGGHITVQIYKKILEMSKMMYILTEN